MDNVFYWVLNMSVTGTLCGALLCFIRRIRRLPAFFAYALWGAAALRFLIPAAWPGYLSFMNLFDRTAVRIVHFPSTQSGLSATMTNYAQAAQSYFPVIYKQNAMEAVFETAAVVWCAVALCAASAVFLLYALHIRRFRGALPKEGFFVSHEAQTPMVAGVFRQKILLPEAVSGSSDLPYILMHERIHMRRRDNLWRMAALLTACVHWFNPFIWIFVKTFFADMERACDQKAAASLNGPARKAYAAAIVRNACPGNALSSAFGGSLTRRRVSAVLTYRKMTVLSGALIGALAAAVVCALLTNPV